ncbi:MAG: glycosyltransferase family 4 protein [Firmicutes bacterium]|nr:glycosyltransferase family 4 protein [Bacillota bacterium]
MKVLLYTENEKMIGKSGLGKAIKHQMKALDENNIEYTTNPKDDYDIVHINYYGPKSYSLAKKAKKEGKKIVYHAHSTEEDFRNSFILSNQVAPLFKKWLIKCYTLGDVILTPTPYSKKLLKNYGIKNPIIDISNGINIKFFEKNEELGKKFRKDFGYKKTDKIIMGVGLYIERKGILDFVELAKRLPEYKFIWFGYSPLAASPNKIREAVNTKLDNLVFAGYVEPNVLRGAYSGSDLYLFPTLEETEGIPIMEACAAKIPSLIRDIPVFSEWLEDGKNVYKAKDIDDFEIKIKKILEGKLPNITKEGYKVALDRDIKKVGKKLIGVYSDLMKGEVHE